MKKNWEEQSMCPRITPKYLNKGKNEKSRKKNKSIGDKSIQKDTSICMSSMYMRNRIYIMTCYPKENIVQLGKLISCYPRICTPTNSFTTQERHDIINGRYFGVRICRLLYNGYIKSFSYYFSSNEKIYTPYPSFHIVYIGIIDVDRFK